MSRADQVVDQDRPRDAEALPEGTGVSELLSERAVGWEVLTGMGLPGVEEDRGDLARGILRRQLIERWRRQRAVRSSQRTELDHEVAPAPVIA